MQQQACGVIEADTMKDKKSGSARTVEPFSFDRFDQKSESRS
jgi:hypothetical protein